MIAKIDKEIYGFPKMYQNEQFTIVPIASPHIYWHKVNMQDVETWLEPCIHWLAQWATASIAYSYSYKRLHTALAVHIPYNANRSRWKSFMVG